MQDEEKYWIEVQCLSIRLKYNGINYGIIIECELYREYRTTMGFNPDFLFEVDILLDLIAGLKRGDAIIKFSEGDFDRDIINLGLGLVD